MEETFIRSGRRKLRGIFGHASVASALVSLMEGTRFKKLKRHAQLMRGPKLVLDVSARGGERNRARTTLKETRPWSLRVKPSAPCSVQARSPIDQPAFPQVSMSSLCTESSSLSSDTAAY